MEEFQDRMRLCFELSNLLESENCTGTGISFSHEFSSNQEEYTTWAFLIDFNISNYIPDSNLEDKIYEKFIKNLCTYYAQLNFYSMQKFWRKNQNYFDVIIHIISHSI